MIKFKKILCPTDFSEPSYEGLRYAVEVARTFNADLCLAHVTPIFSMPPLDMGVGVAVLADNTSTALRAESERRLAEVAAQKLPPGLRYYTLLGDGPPAVEIVRLAEAEGADLIVIATNGETGWRHLVFGSVAETVVRTASCPVLTIRAPREPSEQLLPALIEQTS